MISTFAICVVTLPFVNVEQESVGVTMQITGLIFAWFVSLTDVFPIRDIDPPSIPAPATRPSPREAAELRQIDSFVKLLMP